MTTHMWLWHTTLPMPMLLARNIPPGRRREAANQGTSQLAVTINRHNRYAGNTKCCVGVYPLAHPLLRECVISVSRVGLRCAPVAWLHGACHAAQSRSSGGEIRADSVRSRCSSVPGQPRAGATDHGHVLRPLRRGHVVPPPSVGAAATKTARGTPTRVGGRANGSKPAISTPAADAKSTSSSTRWCMTSRALAASYGSA